MCKPKPGPRCSTHVKKKLDNVMKREQLVLQNKRKVESIKPRDKAHEDKIRVQLKKLDDDYEMLCIQEIALKTIYDSTPAGQQDLLAAIAEIEKEAEFNPTLLQGFKYRTLKSDLEEGKELRRKQNALYRHVKTKHDDLIGYEINDKTSVGDANIVFQEAGDGNVYLGKYSISPIEQDKMRKQHHLIQSRVDKLLSYFESDENDVRMDEDMHFIYKEAGLTPGFTLLGCGAFRAAYRDEKTGKVIKIPVDLDTAEGERSDKNTAEGEQQSYAVVDLEALHDKNAEYVETQFYSSTKYDKVAVVVQDDLATEDYEEVLITKITPIADSLDHIKGIWDVHTGNVKRNKKTGKIVLFDCLSPDGIDW